MRRNPYRIALKQCNAGKISGDENQNEFTQLNGEYKKEEWKATILENRGGAAVPRNRRRGRTPLTKVSRR